MCAALVNGSLVRIRFFLFAVALLLCAPRSWSDVQLPSGTRGEVASNSLIASEVGVQMIKRGGNAIDAAVATGFALSVTHPSAGNLGGGGFMVIRLADGRFVANDHREKAPSLARQDMFVNEEGEMIPDRSTLTHLSVGVPGTVAGLIDVLESHGTLSLEEVIAPAIELAEKGFPLSEELAQSISSNLELLSRFRAGEAKFSKQGVAYEAGDVWRQPQLAATLRRIAEHGKAGFYQGETADLIVAEMRRGGGLISHEDLVGYESVWRKPLTGTYGDYVIHAMGPPSSGGVLLIQMLNMLEGKGLAASGWNSAQAAHAMIEAERRAYADRATHLGDPDYYQVPVAELISKDYARERFSDFDTMRATPSSEVEAGSWNEGPDTTHISSIDGDGNAVAYTTTINLSYGSKIVVEGAGFLLNNEMDDFAAAPGIPNAFGLLGSEANSIAPFKRMLSSMTPSIVTHEEKGLIFVTGSPGGSTIITTVLQVVLNLIEHGMTPNDSVAAPRFHHQWQPDRVIYEQGAFEETVLEELEAKGHQGLVRLPESRSGIGCANSAIFLGDQVEGIGDPRRDTGVAGFWQL